MNNPGIAKEAIITNTQASISIMKGISFLLSLAFFHVAVAYSK